MVKRYVVEDVIHLNEIIWHCRKWSTGKYTFQSTFPSTATRASRYSPSMNAIRDHGGVSALRARPILTYVTRRVGAAHRQPNHVSREISIAQELATPFLLTVNELRIPRPVIFERSHPHVGECSSPCSHRRNSESSSVPSGYRSAG